MNSLDRLEMREILFQFPAQAAHCCFKTTLIIFSGALTQAIDDIPALYSRTRVLYQGFDEFFSVRVNLIIAPEGVASSQR